MGECGVSRMCNTQQTKGRAIKKTDNGCWPSSILLYVCVCVFLAIGVEHQDDDDKLRLDFCVKDNHYPICAINVYVYMKCRHCHRLIRTTIPVYAVPPFGIVQHCVFLINATDDWGVENKTNHPHRIMLNVPCVCVCVCAVIFLVCICFRNIVVVDSRFVHAFRCVHAYRYRVGGMRCRPSAGGVVDQKTANHQVHAQANGYGNYAHIWSYDYRNYHNH